MQRETRLAIQRADHAERWEPMGTRRTLQAGWTITLIGGRVPTFSETRLIVDRTGKVIRRGNRMPAPEAITGYYLPMVNPRLVFCEAGTVVESVLQTDDRSKL